MLPEIAAIKIVRDVKPVDVRKLENVKDIAYCMLRIEPLWNLRKILFHQQLPSAIINIIFFTLPI